LRQQLLYLLHQLLDNLRDLLNDLLEKIREAVAGGRVAVILADRRWVAVIGLLCLARLLKLPEAEILLLMARRISLLRHQRLRQKHNDQANSNPFAAMAYDRLTECCNQFRRLAVKTLFKIHSVYS
jgi:hypothetical protein